MKRASRIKAVRTPRARALDNIAERIVVELQETVVALDLDGRIIFWNAFAEKLHGWSAEEIIGRNAFDVLATTAREDGEHLFRRVRSGDIWTGEFTVHHRDGHPIRLWTSAAPLRDDRGEIFGVVAFGVPTDAAVDEATPAAAVRRSTRTQTSTDRLSGLEEVVRMTERSLALTRDGPYALLAYLLQGVLQEAHLQLRYTSPSAPSTDEGTDDP